MVNNILPWLMLGYVIFLTLIHVKISQYINKRRSSLSNSPESARRMDGWIITTLAMIPVPCIVPEYTKIYAAIYIVASMVWGIIYFDFIAKGRDAG
jgi:hypothetical protein